MPRRFLTLTGIVAAATALGLVIRNTNPPKHGAEQADMPAPSSRDHNRGASTTAASPTFFRLPSPASPDLPKLSFDPSVPPPADAWPAVIDALLNTPEGEAQHTAIAIIQTHGGPDEIAELTRSFDNAPASPAARRIATTLSHLRSDAAIAAARDLLDEAARPSNDPLVRAAALSLVRQGSAADLERIFQRLDATTDPAAQAALTQVVITASDPSSEAFLIGTAVGHGHATRPHARAAAATALRNFPSLPTTDALHRLATTDPDPQVQLAARRALDAIHTPE